MSRSFQTMVVALLAPLGATEVAANGPPPSVDAALIAEIREWAAQPVVTISVRAQNARHATLTVAEIEALDRRWRSELEADQQPLIAQLVGTPLSNYLLQIQARSLGLYPEIFVMDARGLNVGQSSVTSDYWHGDEAKWQETFLAGPDAVFVDEAEFHDATRTWRVQVSLPLVDPDTGRVMGAITTEINLDELARRRGAGVS